MDVSWNQMLALTELRELLIAGCTALILAIIARVLCKLVLVLVLKFL